MTMLLLGGIVVLAAILRFYRLGADSMWLDEALLMDRISGTYFNLLIDWDSNRQGPLFAFFEKAWCDTFGTGDAAARIPAAIFGILSVPVLFLLGKHLFSARVGLFSAFFIAINPYAVYFSQEARPYTLYFLAGLFSLYMWIRLLEEFSWRRAWLFIISALAVLYTHQFGPFLLIACAILFLLRKRLPNASFQKNDAFRLIKILGITILLYIPQMIRFGATFVMKTIYPHIAGAWIPVPTIGSFINAPTHFFMYPGLAAAVYAVIAAGLILWAHSRSKPGMGFWVISSVLFAFLFLPWIISILITPIFQSKYCLPASGVILIALGWAVARLPVVSRWVVVLGLTVLTAIPLYHFYTGNDKDPFRETAQLITRDAHDGDAVIIQSSWAALAFKHYFHLPAGTRVEVAAEPTDLEKAIHGARRVWIVDAYPAHPEWIAEMKSKLSDRGRQDISVDMKKSRKVNPYGFGIENIVVTRYVLHSAVPAEIPTDGE